jgi:N-acetyl-1-D-myo-inositol-2-amino-2-deoxy-alpha-D-glucopyranoside deacetylase
MSESRIREGLRSLRAAGDTTTFEGMDPDGPLPPMFRPDEDIDCEVDAGEYVERKLDALRAHATQITTDGPFFALSNNVGAQAFGREQFRLVKGVAGDAGDNGWETDLFAGVSAG